MVDYIYGLFGEMQGHQVEVLPTKDGSFELVVDGSLIATLPTKGEAIKAASLHMEKIGVAPREPAAFNWDERPVDIGPED